MLSKTSQYAIKACIFVASNMKEGKRVNLNAISEAINSPEAFTAKILQKLVKAKILNSLKGPSGGFEINKENITRINLELIFETIDGKSSYTQCGLGLNECSELHPCPIHYKFKQVRNDFHRMLVSTNIMDLTEENHINNTYLKN